MNLINIEHISKIYGEKVIFDDASFGVQQGDKIGIVGINGTGKSTLLKVVAGEEVPDEGQVVRQNGLKIAFVPQNPTFPEGMDIRSYALQDADAESWQVESNLTELGITQWDQKIDTLSGGQKRRVVLAKILAGDFDVLLLDEPTNHLDVASREKLYEMVKNGRSTMLIVSHDRTLLNLLPCICELERNAITLYGGNFDFYKEQKELALTALQNRLGEKKKELRQACKLAREVMERKNKMNARSEKYAFKKGISRMAVNTLKDKAEKSTVRLGDTHEEKMVSLQDSITDLQNAMPGLRGLQTDFNSSNLHIGKILIVAEQINFGYISSSLWQFPMDIQVRSGDRIHISGNNGSGKTTLVKLLLGELEPTAGTIMRTGFSYLYIDQECSVIDPRLTVFEQTERFNTGNWAEHELKSILNRYLFPYDTWDKGCACLSGGEKIRLLFCCLMIGNNAPDVFILDEPTNNLDIQSVEIITAAIKSYRGTVLLISHDHYFVKEIKNKPFY